MILSFVLSSSIASAQFNPFFGFDFLLTLIAVKWVCWGVSEADLVAFEAYFSEFPEDAKTAKV